MKGNELIYLTCDSQYINCTIKGAIEFKETATYANFNVRMFLARITSMEIYDRGFIIVGQSVENKYLSAAVIIRDGQLIPPLLPLSLGQNPKIVKKQTGK